MSTNGRPHATAAELPLSGGRADATVTLRPLLCAEMGAPPGWFHRAEGPTATLKALGIGVSAEEQIVVPIVAFLLEHPTAGPILIDTGFHRSIADGPRKERSRNLGAIGTIMARSVRMRPDQTVVSQLRSLGVDPTDVGLVVMTHLHFDHASALSDFPAAEVLVSKPEWESATSRGSSLRGYVGAQIDPRPHYRTVDFDGPDVRPRGAFAKTIDLFADGSLTLAYTPGHSRGHLSVIARLADREALIAGDAIYTLQTLREGKRPWRSEDREAFERSIEAIAAYDREQPDAVIIPGHDMAAWEELAEVYD